MKEGNDYAGYQHRSVFVPGVTAVHYKYKDTGRVSAWLFMGLLDKGWNEAR